jgi:hypothetical protein
MHEHRWYVQLRAHVVFWRFAWTSVTLSRLVTMILFHARSALQARTFFRCGPPRSGKLGMQEDDPWIGSLWSIIRPLRKLILLAAHLMCLESPERISGDIVGACPACSGLGMKRSSHPYLPVRPHSDCDVPHIPSLSHHEASRRRPKE